jgi:hypothetical protein
MRPLGRRQISAPDTISKPNLCVCGMIAQSFLKKQFSRELRGCRTTGCHFLTPLPVQLPATLWDAATRFY